MFILFFSPCWFLRESIIIGCFYFSPGGEKENGSVCQADGRVFVASHPVPSLVSCGVFSGGFHLTPKNASHF